MLRQTSEGQAQLSPQNGAVEVTPDLIKLGRDSFYLQTFKDEIFNTDVTGMLDSPLNLLNMGQAILALGGKGTTNLQVPVRKDITVGGQTFKAGTLLNTGLDVPKGALIEIGWFHGATTLNTNVHGSNSDMTTLADASPIVLGIDKDVFLGNILQNSANPRFRLRQGANPTQFFESVDPTPGVPGMNQLVTLPTYPKGSLFALDGLMSNTPGKPFASENNGMSAWQDTLSPPPSPAQDVAVLQRGAKIFQQANCASCHIGRYFTNHQIIGVQKIGTQPMRAPGQAKFTRVFVDPKAYTPDTPVPLPSDPAVLDVPTDITPEESIKLAYARSNPLGGYKVPSLIGIPVTAPYLHDGGVAATDRVIAPDEDGFYTVVRPEEMGLAGTQVRNIPAEAPASLRVLVDRNLRQVAIAQNRQDPTLERANVDGSGHEYWVDEKAGFSAEDQDALVQFLLSLDDDPVVLP